MTPAEASPATAYSLTPAVREAGPLVFASPHSGDHRPADLNADACADLSSLRSAEDALVDQLIASGPDHGAPLLKGLVSRVYIDLNRDPRELDPALIADCPPGPVTAKTAAGFGVAPRRAGDGAPLYNRSLSLAEVQARLNAVHAPYHQALAGLMQTAHQTHGHAILIDWHSMPARAAGGKGRATPGVDVVLGDRHGSSCDARLTRRVRALFEAAGWRVSLNQPYAGGYSTQVWGRPAQGFQAIQIELNRALYLNETTLEPSPDFKRCQAVIARVIAALCAQPLPPER